MSAAAEPDIRRPAGDRPLYLQQRPLNSEGPDDGPNDSSRQGDRLFATLIDIRFSGLVAPYPPLVRAAPTHARQPEIKVALATAGRHWSQACCTAKPEHAHPGGPVALQTRVALAVRCADP